MDGLIDLTEDDVLGIGRNRIESTAVRRPKKKESQS